MGNYVDGFVIPLKSKNLKQYKKMAQLGKKIWVKHGALDYYECIAADFTDWGLGFKKMCNLKKDETVVFAFIVYKNKKHRDQVNKKVHSDPAMNMVGQKMPFDMSRFAMAGFKTLVKA